MKGRLKVRNYLIFNLYGKFEIFWPDLNCKDSIDKLAYVVRIRLKWSTKISTGFFDLITLSKGPCTGNVADTRHLILPHACQATSAPSLRPVVSEGEGTIQYRSSVKNIVSRTLALWAPHPEDRWDQPRRATHELTEIT